MRFSTELVLLIRGAADRPQDLIGGRTPLEYAELPNLRRLSRRGRLEPFQAAPSGHTGHEGGDLFAALGIDADPGRDLPAAAVSWYGSGANTGNRPAVHADPVRLAVSPEVAVVMDPDELGLDRDQAERLVAGLNQELFFPRNARLEVLEPDRWVLHLSEEPALRTVPLQGWIGADAGRGLPEGPDRGAWHRLINEAQMVLAGNPVNRARRAEGLPEVNSLWLWGGGCLPASGSGKASWREIRGPGWTLAGLARLRGIPFHGNAEDVRALATEAGRNPPFLAVSDHPRAAGARGDLGRKIDALEALDREWLGPLEEALASGDLGGAWVILGPEAPTGGRAESPVPPCPGLACRPGRAWPWNRPFAVTERAPTGSPVGWGDLLG